MLPGSMLEPVTVMPTARPPVLPTRTVLLVPKFVATPAFVAVAARLISMVVPFVMLRTVAPTGIALLPVITIPTWNWLESATLTVVLSAVVLAFWVAIPRFPLMAALAAV